MFSHMNNTSRKRIIVIGDVHGCIEEFQELIRTVQYTPVQDRVIQIGDLMDRGPDPISCVKFAQEKGFEVLMGNHEDKHIRFWRHEQIRRATGKANPVTSLKGIRAEQNAMLSADDIAWMSGLPKTLMLTPSIVAVHAGFEPAKPLEDQDNNVIRIRYVDSDGDFIPFSHGSLEQPEDTRFWSEVWTGPQSVVYGHTVRRTVKVDDFNHGACWGIDTGCVYGGYLSAWILTDNYVDLVSVKAKSVYHMDNNAFVPY